MEHRDLCRVACASKRAGMNTRAQRDLRDIPSRPYSPTEPRATLLGYPLSTALAEDLANLDSLEAPRQIVAGVEHAARLVGQWTRLIFPADDSHEEALDRYAGEVRLWSPALRTAIASGAEALSIWSHDVPAQRIRRYLDLEFEQLATVRRASVRGEHQFDAAARLRAIRDTARRHSVKLKGGYPLASVLDAATVASGSPLPLRAVHELLAVTPFPTVDATDALAVMYMRTLGESDDDLPPFLQGLLRRQTALLGALATSATVVSAALSLGAPECQHASVA